MTGHANPTCHKCAYIWQLLTHMYMKTKKIRQRWPPSFPL